MVFDEWARMGGWDADQLHRIAGPETVALATSIAKMGQARSCDCGRAPDPGVCPLDCAPWHPAGGHCACVHGETGQ